MYYKSVSAIAGGGKTAVLLNTFSKGLARCSGSNWVFFPDPNWLCAPGANNELKENLEAVENFKGSRDEKLVVLYCKQLGINYKNLSDEEFRWLIRILKKSKKMGTPISQRKKR